MEGGSQDHRHVAVPEPRRFAHPEDAADEFRPLAGDIDVEQFFPVMMPEWSVDSPCPSSAKKTQHCRVIRREFGNETAERV